jgi:acetyl esterase/lipase
MYYRVPNKRDGALQDAQRSISVLRARATEWDIDPDHIGVLGFSAGGDLAARVACSFSTRSYGAVDAADQASCRPDFAVLVYPAYLADKATGQVASAVAPVEGMPAVFMTQTLDDGLFDIQEYSDALTKAKIPHVAAVFAKGGHGYGLRSPKDSPIHTWPDLAGAWIMTQVGSARK